MSVAGEAGQSLLVDRLSPDAELARNAAFALFVRVYLEQVGLLPRSATTAATSPARPSTQGRRPERRPEPQLDVAELPTLIAAIEAENPHVVAYFVDPARLRALETLDPPATRELLGWLQAQHVHQEEPQVAYELGMLALGVELPAILVRGLRQALVGPETRVAELPDGSGYPTVFLSTLHPQWRAATGACLFVTGGDAEQLAGWAMLLLSRALRPPPGSIRRVGPGALLPLTEDTYDLTLVYNPAPWLAQSNAYGTAVRSGEIVLL
ncbi:MAG: hypothetical protein M3442_02890 [Chloroflexota bacterium]|nr:hypothetical protein [Chloroflexota bacterium]